MTKLFIPGPSNVNRDILQAMATPMIGHRTEEFKQLHKDIIENLKEVLKTENNVFLLTSSASGAMEGAIRNTVEDNVLCLANGAFGRRWHEIAVDNGKDSTLLDFGDGVPYNDTLIRTALAEKQYDAVAMVLNDTATGIENNVSAVRAFLEHYPDTLLLVDAVSGAFGTKIDTKEIDVLVFGTQKALALPPGLAIAVVNDKAMNRAETVKHRGYYFDFLKAKKKGEVNLTLTTPNIPLLFALQKQLQVIKNYGIDKWIDKHEQNADVVRQFFTNKGFNLYIDEAHKSKTVTVIENNKNIDVPHLLAALKKKNYVLANGYGNLKNKTFRVGHMGVEIQETQQLLREIEKLL